MNPSQNPRSIRSKNEITDSLLQLMKSYPYNEITVKQIILESQVARKTFYRNFHSKDDVLDAYIDSIMYQFMESLQQTSICQLSNILDEIFKFCMQNQALLFQLRNNALMHLLLNKWNYFIPIMYKKMVNPDHLLFQTFTPQQIDYIIAFNIGAIWNVITEWIEQEMNTSSDTVKNTLLEYLMNLSSYTLFT